MIIWLASYPKSGNTLIRSILSSYFFSNKAEFTFENLYKITQFPRITHFQKIGVDISNLEETFHNFINAQNSINKNIMDLLVADLLANFVKLSKTASAAFKVRRIGKGVITFGSIYLKIIVLTSAPETLAASTYVSDFIKDINRARVIQAKSIMTPTNSKSSGATVREEMVLEDILQIMSDAPSKPVTIENSTGKITGKIEMSNLIEGMKRPKSQGTNITG